MHPCLRIPEITSMICDNLSSSGSALVALSRTCQILSQAPLAVLWHRQRSLVSLLKCMPSDLWEERGVRRNKTLHFRRPLVPTDWSRFLLYASWIKSLGILDELPYRKPRSLACHVDVEVFLALSLACPTSSLLPNLRSLKWSSPTVTDNIFPYIRLLLGPKLCYLQLSLDGPQVIRLSLLSSLQKTCPSITRIEFNYSSKTSPLATQAISGLICRLNVLRHLTTLTLDHHALIPISAMQTLQSLSLTDIQDGDFASPLPRVRQLGFRSLCNLTIETQKIEDCIRLMESMMAPLKTLQVTTNTRLTAHTLKVFHSTLNAHCSHLTLETLLLQIGEYTPDAFDPVEDNIASDVLTPLLAFRSLKYVELNPGNAFDLDNCIMEDMAMAWSDLETLLLGTVHPLEGKSEVNLQGLVPFAAHCKHLVRLGIALDPTDDNTDPIQKPGGGACNKSLRILDVGNSEIDDPMAVAAFLSDIFPEVCISTWDSPYGWEGETTSLEAKWGQVERMIRIFASVRQQEKNFCQTSGGDSQSTDDNDAPTEDGASD